MAAKPAKPKPANKPVAIAPIGKLADAVTAFRSAFAKHEPYVEAFDAIIAASGYASRAERDAGILALLDPAGLEQVSDHPEVSGYLCVASGALVEDGASTTLCLDRILDRLADGAALLAAAGPALEDADLDEMHEPPPAALGRDERRWIAAFKSHVLGAMARLARDADARKQARAHPRLAPAIRALAQRIEAEHLRYIVEVLDLLDDEPLVLVDLRRGGHVTRYRAFAVRNGFHLMTLLDGHDPHALRDRNVEARSGYFAWPALVEAEGGFATAGPDAWLRGELRSVDLPRFEGVRTVLRTATTFGRTWSAALVAPFHGELRESLVIEHELSPDEARPLLQRMAAAARELDK
jgi:hypothetical protein